MSKIEKTKENIGVNSLDEKTKKELFNKFIQAGGQVITEKKERGLKDFDREKQKLYRQKIEAHKEKLQKAKPPIPSPTKQSKPATSRQQIKIQARGEKTRSSFSAFIDRLTIRFKLLFLGVADFWGGYYKSGFIERFNTEYKAALLELQMIYLDIFKQNPSAGKKIIEKLDSIKPLYYELIEKIASIYDRGSFMLITQAYEEFPDIAQKINDYRDFFLSLFKKLYVIYPHSITISDAFERAIAFQQEIEKQKSTLYSSKRRKAKNDIYIVFNKLFPRLYWLFCNYYDSIIPIGDNRIETMLEIKPDDKPGKRVKGAEITEVEVPLPGNLASQTSEDKEPLSSEIKKGIELMYTLDMKKLRKEFDRENRFKFVKENDPIIITRLLLQEFDQEYSLILTTNKIKYNTIYESAGKIDYRTRLSDLYNGMRECFDVVRQYTDALEVYEKTRNDRPFSNTQYIEYSKKLTQLEKALKNLTAQARMTISSYMEKVANELKNLIDDMNGRQLIVANPQDVLVFESELEGEKKLSGKKVYECIYLTHCFAAALSYRLSLSGDLGGKAPEANEETSLQISLTENKHQETASSPQQKKETPSKDEEVSILKELDDLL
ncbi:MAG: hypothetical protein N2316_06645 [Spirochaetes bacterium]|nr:hypothetical protein [Spirochaetota bacterium]